MLTETVMRRAIERGLTAADFENMTVGMIIDYLTVCQNEDIDARKKKNAGQERSATQADIDAW